MKKVCDSCGGSGQIGFFQGESRFVISWDECLECNGTGMQDDENSEKNDDTSSNREKQNPSDKTMNSENSKKQ